MRRSICSGVRSNSNQAGFSLVELMISVAIVAILVSVAIPMFEKVQARVWTLGGE